MKRASLVAVSILFAGASATAQWSGGFPPLGGFPIVVVPVGNPITPNKVLLGKALFWDEQLSSSRMTACGTCHEPRFGMADGRFASLGQASVHPGPDLVRGTGDDRVGARGPVKQNTTGRYEPDALFGLEPQVGNRRAPTTINAAFLTNLFWDGRVRDGRFVDPITSQVILQSTAMLENLVALPFVNDVEMAHTGRTWNDVVARIQQSRPLELSPQLTPDLAGWIQGRSYADLYNDAFGTPVIDAGRTVMAVATYLRTLVSDQSPFDAFRAGNMAAMTALEQQGLVAFRALRCTQCHIEPIFTDNGFHNTGVRPVAEDPGAGGNGTFGGPANGTGRFRTPSLRNVALRAPFFHNGGLATLDAVVDFYSRGGDFPPAAREIGILNITPADRTALVAFLNALTDPRVANERAPFDRPALASSRAPVRSGTATAGSGAFRPSLIAYEPLAAGNPSFTVALERGLGGAAAYLGISPASVPAGVALAGAQVYLDFTHPGAAVVPHGPLQGTGDGNGFGSMSFGIPASSTLVGVEYFFQWFVIDTGAPYGLAASDFARATIF